MSQSRSYAFGTQAATIHADSVQQRIAHELEPLAIMAQVAPGSVNASTELAERLAALVTKLKEGRV